MRSCYHCRQRSSLRLPGRPRGGKSTAFPATQEGEHGELGIIRDTAGMRYCAAVSESQKSLARDDS